MKLPDGWFPEDDIAAYRRLCEALPEYGLMAELGTWLGRSLCSVADILNRKNVTVFAVDTFKGSAGFEQDFDIGTRDAYEEFYRNAERFGFGSNLVIHRCTTDEAAKLVPNELDLVFIDADHSYAAVKKDIENWKPKIRKGGVLAGDDNGYPDVRTAVAELLGVVELEASLWVTNV